MTHIPHDTNRQFDVEAVREDGSLWKRLRYGFDNWIAATILLSAGIAFASYAVQTALAGDITFTTSLSVLISVGTCYYGVVLASHGLCDVSTQFRCRACRQFDQSYSAEPCGKQRIRGRLKSLPDTEVTSTND
jgi:hypothetical protein